MLSAISYCFPLHVSHFLFYAVVCFSVDLMVLCKRRFRVKIYVCLSAVLRSTARKINAILVLGQSPENRLLKVVHICNISVTAKILSINFLLPDELLQICSFY